MENKRHYLYEIQSFSDGDGNLTVIEENNQIPFKIRRVFYEYGICKDSVRGMHANRNSRFCLIAVSGSCTVIVDDGFSKITYELNNPNKILYLDRMIWKTMTNFSKDCVLLILSDCFYDKNEYIRDFEAFLKEIS